MSWDAVKEKLKAIISEEDTHNPLNDDEIVEKLKEQGIDLARRTVAKYRKRADVCARPAVATSSSHLPRAVSSGDSVVTEK